MPQPLLSIFIPVYNVQDYLSECLDSVFNQNVPGFEIICVNDGSTDDSRDILVKFEKENEN
jgi:glycosyltransferase involved in cell wall biosynthesis